MHQADLLSSVQGQGVVDGQSGLTKVVLARRSDVAFRGTLDPLMLLAALQVLLGLAQYMLICPVRSISVSRKHLLRPA